MERTLLSALHREIAPVDPATTVADELARLSAEPVHGSGVSHRLRERGTWAQMREYFAHRSIYHLKEGDPHAWLIPRLAGPAKASFVAVEFDDRVVHLDLGHDDVSSRLRRRRGNNARPGRFDGILGVTSTRRGKAVRPTLARSADTPGTADSGARRGDVREEQ